MSRPYSQYSIDALERLAAEAPKIVLEELRFRHSTRAKRLLRTLMSASEDPAKPQSDEGAVPAVYFAAPTRASRNTLARLSPAKRSEYLAAYQDLERAIARLKEVDAGLPAATRQCKELERRTQALSALESLAISSHRLHAMASRRGATLPPPANVGLDPERFQALVAAAEKMDQAQATLSALRNALHAAVRARDAAAARCGEILEPLQTQDDYETMQARKHALSAHVTKLQSQSSWRLEVLWRHREEIDPLRAEAARLVLRRRAGFGD